MNRIIFSRPNKTVRGNFQAKGVMKMLEQNRSTWLSLQGMVCYALFRLGTPPCLYARLTELLIMSIIIARRRR